MTNGSSPSRYPFPTVSNKTTQRARGSKPAILIGLCASPSFTFYLAIPGNPSQREADAPECSVAVVTGQRHHHSVRRGWTVTQPARGCKAGGRSPATDRLPEGHPAVQSLEPTPTLPARPPPSTRQVRLLTLRLVGSLPSRHSCRASRYLPTVSQQPKRYLNLLSVRVLSCHFPTPHSTAAVSSQIGAPAWRLVLGEASGGSGGGSSKLQCWLSPSQERGPHHPPLARMLTGAEEQLAGAH